MIKIRHRLISWLIKAYIKKWGKLILIYFATGLIVFFAFRLIFGDIIGNLQTRSTETIGMVGTYELENLPSNILNKLSLGLTSVAKDGSIKPGIAEKWKIGNNDKAYVFYLKENIYFTDGTNLTSDHIRYNFADTSIIRPNKFTIAFMLKDSYSPFLVTVGKPIFKDGLIGVSDNKLKDIKLNGNFVQSLDLVSKNGVRIIYQFYPTNDALKIAYSLGEVSKIVGLSDVKFKNTEFDSFKNAKVERRVNYQQLVTLFYNTSDELLSSKTLREALSYTIPNDFSYGLRNFGPFLPFSFVTQGGVGWHKQDIEHAKELLDKSKKEIGSDKKITLAIETLSQYKSAAEEIANIWKKLDIDVRTKIVNKVPSRFQVFLGEFNVPQDVDQYALWHSDQPSNITHYANLRVDKLLEDGRKEVHIEKRKIIYANFQKYILADPPASFLFFPYTYDVTRK